MASDMTKISTASSSRLANDVLPTFKLLTPNPTDPPLPEAKSSQDENSLLDSGYSSSLPSPDQNESRGKGERDITLPQKAIPFPLASQKDLLAFKKEVDQATITRFNEIVPEIERLLLSHVKSGSGRFSGPARYKPMAIRLMVLGKTEADAKECMVVFCPANLYKRVQQFFNKQQIIKDLCEPSDPAVPSFKAVVSGNAPRLRVALSDIQVQCTSSLTLEDTFCGKPIRLVNETGDARCATFGGIVKVTGSDGDFKLYGLTAGHSLLDWQDPDTSADTLPGIHVGLNAEDEDVGGDDGQDKTGEGLLEPEDPFAPAPTIVLKPEQDETAQLWSFTEPQELGKILKNPDRGTDEDQQYFDWALFELSKYLPNVLLTVELSGKVRKHPLSLAHKKFSLDTPSQPVTMMGGSQGSKSGVLSKLPGRIIIGPGDSFIDAYLLTLDEDSVSDGDSGSWVVDPATFEVYGHVVATDMFGDAYVIPLVDTLADIQRCFGAKSVDLPSTVDFSIIALTESSPVADQIVNWSETELDPFPKFATAQDFFVGGLDLPSSVSAADQILDWSETGLDPFPKFTTTQDFFIGEFNLFPQPVDSGYNSMNPTPKSAPFTSPSTDSGYDTLETTPLQTTPLQTTPTGPSPKRRRPINSERKRKRARGS